MIKPLRVELVGQLLCLGGAAWGLLGLLGWLLGVPWLFTLWPGGAPMMPNTALGLVLVGAAGAGSRRRGRGRWRILALMAACLALAIGLFTLAEYAFGRDLWIDLLFFETVAGPFPGRMSPPTALALALLGLGLLIFDTRRDARIRPSEWLLVSAWLVAFTGLVGQIFGTGPLYELANSTVVGVAAPAALAILLVSSGALLERPNAGIMAVATSPGPGGVLLRRLSVAAVLAPLALNILLTWMLGLFAVRDLELVYASLTVMATIVGLLLLTITTIPLDRIHAALESSRARAAALFQDASDAIFVADEQGRYTEVNEAGCRLIGYTRDELLGKTITDLLAPDEIPLFEAHRGRVLEGHHEVGEWRLRREDGTLVPTQVSAKRLPDGRWQAFVHDISERKRAQAQLQDAMERLDLALRGGDLGVWDWNVTTGKVIFDARWAQMRGFRLEEVEPRVETWASGIHPDDQPRVQAALDDHFAGRTPEYECELRVATKEGEWIWILDHGRVFARDAYGQPTRMVGTELDITARKRAEEEIRLSEAKLAGIVSSSADAIISIDEDQRIVLFNSGAEAIFGHSAGEAIGAPLDILLPERLGALHRREIEGFAAEARGSRRMAAGRPAVTGRRKNGEEFPAEAAISKLEVGGTRLLTVILRDVSEQRLRERDSELLAELGALATSTLDEGVLTRKVAELAAKTFCDVCTVEVLGHEPRSTARAVAATDPSKAWACELLEGLELDPARPHLTSSALAMRQSVLVDQLSVEATAALAQSEEHLQALRALEPRSLIAVPLVVRDEVLGAIAFLSSQPRRVYGPREVRFAEHFAQRTSLAIERARLYGAMEHAVRVRDDVLGVVAHDLRNPLGTILLQASLLSRVPPRDEVQAAAQVVERSANRMNRLIADLLDATRLEAGGLTIDATRVSAREVIEESADLQRPLVGSASIDLRVDVRGDLPDICADRDRLLQVLQNLVANAVRFTPPDGRIIMGAAARDRDVLFWVADTGTGIDADDVPHVFDRFWQGRRLRARGAGLGLPIVKGIVEAHHGRVWVESTPGRGSTFFFTIPRIEPTARRPAEPVRPRA